MRSHSLLIILLCSLLVSGCARSLNDDWYSDPRRPVSVDHHEKLVIHGSPGHVRRNIERELGYRLSCPRGLEPHGVLTTYLYHNSWDPEQTVRYVEVFLDGKQCLPRGRLQRYEQRYGDDGFLSF